MDGPIYMDPKESKALFKTLFIILLLPTGRVSFFIMPWLWRARTRAQGSNWGVNPSDASPSDANESFPLGKGFSSTVPFNWGNHYLVEMPTAIEAFIAIMEINLLREFETMMGFPLLPNPFWTACILLARDIQKKIQTTQGIRDALETIQ